MLRARLRKAPRARIARLASITTLRGRRHAMSAPRASTMTPVCPPSSKRLSRLRARFARRGFTPTKEQQLALALLRAQYAPWVSSRPSMGTHRALPVLSASTSFLQKPTLVARAPRAARATSSRRCRINLLAPWSRARSARMASTRMMIQARTTHARIAPRASMARATSRERIA